MVGRRRTVTEEGGVIINDVTYITIAVKILFFALLCQLIDIRWIPQDYAM